MKARDKKKEEHSELVDGESNIKMKEELGKRSETKNGKERKGKR